MKLSKYYLFDVKRWAEWLIWGVMVAVLACIIGWAAHLYGVNQTLDSHALRYRILRMELGYTQPNIARLDSLSPPKTPPTPFASSALVSRTTN